MRFNCLKSQYSNLNTIIACYFFSFLFKFIIFPNEPISGLNLIQGRSWQQAVNSSSNSKTETVNCKTAKQSRSSAWLEHYTDNVGVSSSTLLGTTCGELIIDN